MTHPSRTSHSRRLHRFLTADKSMKTGEIVALLPQEYHHLTHSLRLKAGDECWVTDGSGREARARIEQLKDGKAFVKVLDRMAPSKSESAYSLRFFLAMPQKGKMDVLVSQAQQLGVDEILPLETERTQIKMTHAAAEKVLARWQKIAAEAAKQSGSLNLIALSTPLSLQNAFKQIPSEEPLIFFHLERTGMSFQAWIEKLKESKMSSGIALNLFVGPEGGFSEKEIVLAKSRSATFVNLGPGILKVDTAFLAVASTLRLLFS